MSLISISVIWLLSLVCLLMWTIHFYIKYHIDIARFIANSSSCTTTEFSTSYGTFTFSNTFYLLRNLDTEANKLYGKSSPILCCRTFYKVFSTEGSNS